LRISEHNFISFDYQVAFRYRDAFTFSDGVKMEVPVINITYWPQHGNYLTVLQLALLIIGLVGNVHCFTCVGKQLDEEGRFSFHSLGFLRLRFLSPEPYNQQPCQTPDYQSKRQLIFAHSQMFSRQ
jgi:hypothetical protein